MIASDGSSLSTRGTRRRALAFRAVVLLVLAAGLSLVYWSINRLIPLQRQTRTVTSNLSRLTADIQLMESRWTSNEVERILTQFERLPDRLLVGSDALDLWLKSLRDQLVPLALESSTEFGTAAVQQAASRFVTTIPATVSVAVRPTPGIESYRSPYQRVLRLTQFLSNQPKRVDLLELDVSGNSNSVSRAVAVLNLWASDAQRP
jgi:hypothetical protein